MQQGIRLLGIGGLTLLLTVGCAQSGEYLPGERATMGSGGGTSLYRNALASLTCLATPESEVVASGDLVEVSVQIVDPVLPVSIPGFVSSSNKDTHTLKGRFYNATGDTVITVTRTVHVRDQVSTGSCSFTLTVVPEGQDPADYPPFNEND